MQTQNELFNINHTIQAFTPHQKVAPGVDQQSKTLFYTKVRQHFFQHPMPAKRAIDYGIDKNVAHFLEWMATLCMRRGTLRVEFYRELAAKKFYKTERTISRWLETLEYAGFIKRHHHYASLLRFQQSLDVEIIPHAVLQSYNQKNLIDEFLESFTESLPVANSQKLSILDLVEPEFSLEGGERGGNLSLEVPTSDLDEIAHLGENPHSENPFVPTIEPKIIISQCCSEESSIHPFKIQDLEATTPLTKISDIITDLKISSNTEIHHNHRENEHDDSSGSIKTNFEKPSKTHSEHTKPTFPTYKKELTQNTLQRALDTLQEAEKSIYLWWQILLALGFSSNYEFLFRRRVLPQVERCEFMTTLQDMALFVSRNDIEHPAKWLNIRLRRLAFGEIAPAESLLPQRASPALLESPPIPEPETPFQIKMKAVELERKLARAALQQHEQKMRLRQHELESARKEARFWINAQEHRKQLKAQEIEVARRKARDLINQAEERKKVPQKIKELKQLFRAQEVEAARKQARDLINQAEFEAFKQRTARAGGV